jgi:hypothetical protein
MHLSHLLWHLDVVERFPKLPQEHPDEGNPDFTDLHHLLLLDFLICSIYVFVSRNAQHRAFSLGSFKMNYLKFLFPYK